MSPRGEERTPPDVKKDLPRATIVIFGASGDLTQRKLVPALHSLVCAGHLSPETRVLGVGRTDLSDAVFRERMLEGVRSHARLKPDGDQCAQWDEFGKRFSYFQMSTDDSSAYPDLYAHLEQLTEGSTAPPHRLFYLATPPQAVPTIVDGLGGVGLAREREGWNRVVFEKPFGEDAPTARELNRRVHDVFDESQIFRIDHYLGKETVQNLLAFRFANAIFEPLWNRDYVDHIQITVAESIRIERRGAYYDRAGVLRDIIQNHVFQLLALIAMEPPGALSAKPLRDEKMKVFDALHPVSPDDIVLGQYTGYTSEKDVREQSRTPTFAALRLGVENWRWRGVPFFVRSGKALKQKTTEITLQFKDVPHQLFPGDLPSPNRLSLRIQPEEGILLQFQVKLPGAGMATQPFDMRFSYDDHFEDVALPDAYERLLLDALQGDASLFIRCDEIERCWELLEQVLADERVPDAYPVGSWGPHEANRMLGRADRAWLTACHRTTGES